MKKLFFIALLSLIGMTNVMAQQDTAADEKVYEYESVDGKPSFPGGPGEMMTWLENNMKYPIVAEENGIQGRVTVEFTVMSTGETANPKVIKSVDPSLGKEAVRLIKAMPKWKPGKKGGAFVNVKYTLTIPFRIK